MVNATYLPDAISWDLLIEELNSSLLGTGHGEERRSGLESALVTGLPFTLFSMFSEAVICVAPPVLLSESLPVPLPEGLITNKHKKIKCSKTIS